MSPAPCAYAILGVERSCSDEEIKQAYRVLALRHHPDKAKDGESRQLATQRFQEIQAAYEAVSPGNRKRYDMGAFALITKRTDLMDACESGDFVRVTSLLAGRADVHEEDSTGRSALMFAASSASLEVIRALLENHADVETRNCAGHTCVMFAIGAGLKIDSAASAERALRHLECVRLLLDEGAPVNGATGYGLSGLMLACASGRLNMIELLLERGADVRACSDIGLTALVMAADKGHVSAVRRLLAASAEANHRYGNGKTPLMGAAALGYTQVVAALLEHRAEVDATSDDGHFALLYAVEKGLKDGLVCPIEGESVQKPGAEETVRVLLEADADVNLTGPRQRTALHVACASGSAALAELLVAAGARVDAPDEEGASPAEMATARQQPAMLEALGLGSHVARLPARSDVQHRPSYSPWPGSFEEGKASAAHGCHEDAPVVPLPSKTPWLWISCFAFLCAS
eukprot:TRINITY_DN77464_c0_g1_i1.p1 TRINITY_DN77464_c0_g1~~TRINITY_DN77464_c0_g1_i1.p1  ORF type:complete len:478 (-),score=95.93 TRINITY_DN77464_c0_g1_i1:108-1490(-)